MAELERDFDSVIDIYERYGRQLAVVYHEGEYYVYTADGELVQMEWITPARIFAGLRVLLGDIRIHESSVVPIEVAIAGKPHIVTYAYLVRRNFEPDRGQWYAGGREMFAREVDIQQNTIRKYINRVKDEALEYRVGGEREDVRW